MLAIYGLCVTKDGSLTSRLAFAALPHRTSDRSPCKRALVFSVVGMLTLPASVQEPVKLSRGDAEPALSSFGIGGLCVLGLS